MAAIQMIGTQVMESVADLPTKHQVNIQYLFTSTAEHLSTQQGDRW